MSGGTPPVTQHRRIMASAGSGKTYRLVLRAIELLRAGAPIHTMLCSTFTRKAAGEIGERLLERLCLAASSDAEARALDTALARDPTLPPGPHPLAPLTRADAATLLQSTVEQVHRMQVRTLDGFFATVVMAFSSELGLPSAPRVVEPTEEARLRNDAIQAVLAQEDGDAIVRLLRGLTQGKQGWAVDELIRTTLDDIMDVYRVADPEAWSRTVVPPPPADGATAEAVAALRRAIDPAATGEGVTDAARRALAKVADRVAADDWLGAANERVLQTAASGDATYRKKELPPEVARPLLDLAEIVRHHVCRMHRDRGEAMADVCARVDLELAARKAAAGIVSYADLAAALAGRLAPAADPRPDRGAAGSTPDGTPTLDLELLAWRLDARLDHLLLDEFQDTSVQQWEVLQPIARRLVEDASADRSVFVVGDVKQSIYGWRGGRPEILEFLPELLLPGAPASYLADDVLAVSWRSAPVVMETVNAILDGLAGSPAVAAATGDAGSAIARVAPAWDAAWTAHASAPPLADMAGYTEVRVVAPGENGRPNRDACCDVAAARIASWHRATPTASIGVLTRSRATAAAILERLQRSDPPVPAVGDGGRPIVDEPAATPILSLLLLADHPEHRAAAVHVLTSPFAAALGFEDALPGDADGWRRTARRLSRRMRGQIARDGLDGTVASLVRQVTPACTARQRTALRQLAATAATHPIARSLRPADFVQYAESARLTDGSDAPVRVMTVHASKGLEFDLVVLPDLDQSMARTPSAMIDREGTADRIRAAGPWMGDDIRNTFLHPDDAERFVRTYEDGVRDNLSVLYVALTRARAGLSLITAPIGVTKKGPSYAASLTAGRLIVRALDDREPAEILEHAEAPRGEDGRPTPAERRLGDPLWSRGSAAEMTAMLRAAASSGTSDGTSDAVSRGGDAAEPDAAEPDAADATAAPRRTDPSTARLTLLPPRRPPLGLADSAARVAERRTPLAVRLAPSDREPRDRGTVVHGLFELVTWCETFDRDDAALLAWSRRLVPRRPDAWHRTQIASFRRALAGPNLRALLSLGDRDPDRITVQPERPWARMTPDGVQRGAVDRVEITTDAADRPIGATIVDYKTDPIVDPADPAERDAHVARYAPQVATYRAVIAAALGLAPESVDVVLAFTDVDLVVPVPCAEDAPPRSP